MTKFALSRTVNKSSMNFVGLGFYALACSCSATFPAINISFTTFSYEKRLINIRYFNRRNISIVDLLYYFIDSLIVIFIVMLNNATILSFSAGRYQ